MLHRTSPTVIARPPLATRSVNTFGATTKTKGMKGMIRSGSTRTRDNICDRSIAMANARMAPRKCDDVEMDMSEDGWKEEECALENACRTMGCYWYECEIELGSWELLRKVCESVC